MSALFSTGSSVVTATVNVTYNDGS